MLEALAVTAVERDPRVDVDAIDLGERALDWPHGAYCVNVSVMSNGNGGHRRCTSRLVAWIDFRTGARINKGAYIVRVGR